MTAFYDGPMAPERVAALLERHFAELGKGPAQPAASRCTELKAADRFEIYRHIDSHQAHTVLGVAAGGICSPQRHAVALLANILGGPGMNSLLNVALREKRGLVYSVDAYTATFSCGGLLTVYFGCDPEDTAKCLRLCHDTFSAISSGVLLSPRKLEMAKKQFLGQLAIASENRENSLLSAARATLFTGRPKSPAETVEAIRAVGLEDIQALCHTLTSASVLTLGPGA